VVRLNPLLQKPAVRRLTRVVLVGHPDAEVFVRSLTGVELATVFEKVREAKNTAGKLAAQVEAYVCDAKGESWFKPGEGTAAVEAMDGVDVNHIIDEGDKLNILSRQSIEEERKN